MIQRLSDLAVVLPSGFERVLMLVGGSMGGIFTFLYGDAGPLLIWLVVFVILDFLSGTLAAVLNGTWTSKRNMLGVLKKILAFCIVALAHGLDVAFCELLPFRSSSQSRSAPTWLVNSAQSSKTSTRWGCA